MNNGIYFASKVAHAPRWQALRDGGIPIISTWIDEAGPGETNDFEDLWGRCIGETMKADLVVVYREPGEVLKGAFVELGAALATGKTVFAVGIEEFTVSAAKNIRHFKSLDDVLAAIRERMTA